MSIDTEISRDEMLRKNKVLPAVFYWGKKEVVKREVVKRANLEKGGIIEEEEIITRDLIDVPMIRITIDSRSELEREVQERDKIGRETQYRKFMEGDKFQVDGTPLEMWPVVRPSMLQQLHQRGVLSVEQLAEMTETQAQSFMGGITLREKAREFLRNKQASNAAEDVVRMREEMEALRAQYSELQKQLVKTAAPDVDEGKGEDLIPVTKRGPGRPRKSEEAFSA